MHPFSSRGACRPSLVDPRSSARLRCPDGSATKRLRGQTANLERVGLWPSSRATRKTEDEHDAMWREWSELRREERPCVIRIRLLAFLDCFAPAHRHTHTLPFHLSTLARAPTLTHAPFVGGACCLPCRWWWLPLHHLLLVVAALAPWWW